jgi:hypothetical protein
MSKYRNNTVYDYYERVSSRYYKALPVAKDSVKFIWEPLAKKVKVAGFEDYDFFILGSRCHFQLREALSGWVVFIQNEAETRDVREGSLKTFLDFIPAEINKRGGRAYLNRLIVDMLVNQGNQISPRYKSYGK